MAAAAGQPVQPHPLGPEYTEALEQLQKANLELRNLVNKKSKFDAQLNENSMVSEVGVNRRERIR